MRIEYWADSKLTGTREAVGTDTEWTVRDDKGTVTGHEPLTEGELAELVNEGKPTPDEKLVAALQAADSNAKTTAALIERFGG
jgi:hypothetical protein